MPNPPAYMRAVEGGVELRVYVNPRSSKNSVAGEHNGALKIKLTSAPVDGEANACLVEFLSKILGVSKSAVEIKSGETSRRKTIFIVGVSVQNAINALK